MIHEPLEGKIGIAPTERRKKPPLRSDLKIPDRDINATFKWSTFIYKVLLMAAAAGGTYYGAVEVLQAKSWTGVARLNKTYDWEISFSLPTFGSKRVD